MSGLAISRRSLLLGMAATPASTLTPVVAREGCRYDSRFSLVKEKRFLGSGTYFTYPHSNGFISNNQCIIARKLENGTVEYLVVDLATQERRTAAVFLNPRLYYAVSRNQSMAVPTDSGVSIVNLTDGASHQLASWPEWKTLADCDISPDGTKILINRFSRADARNYRVDLIDTSSGEIRNIFEASFPLDHAHFSPFDPSWICFCDGTVHSRQRMWVWHAEHAPAGKNVFRQTRADGKFFDIGHERALFNRLSLLTIAYSSGSAAPRGLYEVGFDGAVKLISESNTDSHCNVSHDGRWAVVSSLAPVDLDLFMLDLCKRVPANWIKSDRGYVISDITAVNMKTGHREFLFRATNAVTLTGSLQPYEAQPAISPDGRWVIVKDAASQQVISLELDGEALQRFLE